MVPSQKKPINLLIGYARVSTDDQANDAEMIESRAAGCDTIYEERRTGASQARPVLAKLIDKIRRGDALVVVRIDRLARSVSHLLAAIEELEDKRAHSARCTIRSIFPLQGMFSSVPWRSCAVGALIFPNGRKRGLKRRKPAVSAWQSRLP